MDCSSPIFQNNRAAEGVLYAPPANTTDIVQNLPTDPNAQLLRALWNNLISQNTSSPSIRTTLSNFKRRTRHFQKNPIVTVSHASAGKLDNLLVHLEYWGGPASVALLVAGHDDADMLADFIKTHDKELENTTIHVLMEYAPSMKKVYPHNKLRNLALENAGSDYILAMDVDLIPSLNSYSELMALLKSGNSALRRELRNHRLMVLPAFDILAKPETTHAAREQLPSSKDELAHLVHKQRAEPFHWHFKLGQKATNYKKWFSYNGTKGEDEFYFTTYNQRFEPYVLAYRPGLPRYWGMFRGWGKDKTSWFEEMDRAGYKLGVMVHQFVCHLQHPYLRVPEQFDRNKKLYEKVFVPYLDRRYGECPKCLH